MQWRAPRGRRAVRVEGQSPRTTDNERPPHPDRNLQRRPLHHAIIQQFRYDHSSIVSADRSERVERNRLFRASCSIPKPANIRQSRPRIGMASCSLRRPASYINDKTTGIPAYGMAARIAASLSVTMSVTLRVVSVRINGFMMNDDAAPNFQHGGSTIPYNGSGPMAEGAIDYIGPCPPAGTLHRYVWTIEALDKSGKIVTRTTAECHFPVR